MSIEEKIERSLFALYGTFMGDLLWYGLLACGVWAFFYVVFRDRFRRRRVFRRDPTGRQVAREIAHSLRSIAIFSLVAGAVVYAACSGWTRIYVDIARYGWGWFFLSIGAMIVLHDAYFYWTHRAMHNRRLYRFFHRTHHLSTNPTPWAAYAFSPAEALVQAGIGPLVVMLLPVHPAAFALFMVWQISFNVVGHSGYEIFPRRFLNGRAGRVLNSVTHHSLHHEKFHSNFGLYFNVWDRLMGTNHASYGDRFELATSERPHRPAAQLAER
jgi:Delta7-sterol 5-desaturase